MKIILPSWSHIWDLITRWGPEVVAKWPIGEGAIDNDR